MFCAFQGPPKIVRLYGNATVITPDRDQWQETVSQFPTREGTRSVIVVDLTRIADSCGYGVPKYEYVEERPTLENAAAKKGDEGMVNYKLEKNQFSIDGLPGLRTNEVSEDRK